MFGYEPNNMSVFLIYYIKHIKVINYSNSTISKIYEMLKSTFDNGVQ